MNVRFLLRILRIPLMLLFTIPLYSQNGLSWKLLRDSNDIKSYTRSVPGTGVLELKAITVIDAKIEVVGEVLRDIPSYPEWMTKCREATIIKHIAQNTMIVYIVSDLPAPVNDRDLVVKSETKYFMDMARVIVTITSIEDSTVPPHRGVVRMTDFLGEYQLEYLSREKTGVIYTYRADPKGTIPTFMLNIFSRESLYRTLQGLRKMVERPKYREKALDSSDRMLIERTLKNREKARTILTNRFLEYIHDHTTVEQFVKDAMIFNMFVDGDGGLASKIFYSWGSPVSIRELVCEILRIHCKKYTDKREAIDALINDNEIITAIISGKKAGEEPVIETIKKRLLYSK